MRDHHAEEVLGHGVVVGVAGLLEDPQVADEVRDVRVRVQALLAPAAGLLAGLEDEDVAVLQAGVEQRLARVEQARGEPVRAVARQRRDLRQHLVGAAVLARDVGVPHQVEVLVLPVEREARRTKAQHGVLRLGAEVAGMDDEAVVDDGAELDDRPFQLVREHLVPGRRALRERGQVVAGPVAAEQAALLPAAGHIDAGRVGAAREPVEEHEEAALVVRAQERQHPLLLLPQQARSQRHVIERERDDRRRRPGADVVRQRREPADRRGCRERTRAAQHPARGHGRERRRARANEVPSPKPLQR